MNGFERFADPQSKVVLVKLINNGKYTKLNETSIIKSISIQFEDTAYSPQVSKCIELKWFSEISYYKWTESNCEFKFCQCECSNAKFGFHSIKKYQNETLISEHRQSLEHYKIYFITYCTILYGFLCLFFISLSITYIKYNV
jgi:hypothetical protein